MGWHVNHVVSKGGGGSAHEQGVRDIGGSAQKARPVGGGRPCDLQYVFGTYVTAQLRIWFLEIFEYPHFIHSN